MTKASRQREAHLDRMLDEALRDTFPASDAIAVSVPLEGQAALVENRERSRFELNVDGGTVFVEYRALPGALEIVHTEVPRKLEGRGWASRIAALAIEEVRRRGLRLIPVCPFFTAYLKKHPEHSDLIDPNHRPA